MFTGIHLLFVHRDIRPWFKKSPVDAPSVRFIFASGTRFFIIGIAAIIVWSTDNLVISHFLGPEDVTRYAVTFKLFVTGFSLFTMVHGVLRPLYGVPQGWVSGSGYNGLIIMLQAFFRF